MNKCLTLNGPWTKQAEADKTRFFEEAGDFLPRTCEHTDEIRLGVQKMACAELLRTWLASASHG